MTALLIVNPKATTTSQRARDILVRALRSEVDLRVGYTRRRGHAASMAKEAVAEGMDLVVALGGDGTVNEAVNGLLAEGGEPEKLPRLAVVPGGSTNVFARAVGLPVDWVDCTGVILDALRDNRWRTVGLGRANGRYFTFCAGMGLDAAAIRRVERARVRGTAASPGLYIRSTLSQYASGADRGHPEIRMEIPGQAVHDNLGLAIVQNTSPWTYLGARGVSPNPHASFDSGLDVMSLNALSVPATIRAASQLITGRKGPHGKNVVAYHDLKKFKLSSARPQAFQLDGDYLGECDEVVLESAPEALRVVC